MAGVLAWGWDKSKVLYKVMEKCVVRGGRPQKPD